MKRWWNKKVMVTRLGRSFTGALIAGLFTFSYGTLTEASNKVREQREEAIQEAIQYAEAERQAAYIAYRESVCNVLEGTYADSGASERITAYCDIVAP